MEQITIFGASGRVGRLVVADALAAGYSVVAFVHVHNPFQGVKGVTVVQGDIGDSKQVMTAIQGSRVVISTLSSWHSKQHNVLVRAMNIILPSMRELGISRIITLTGIALSSKDKLGLANKLSYGAFKIVAGKVLIDAEIHLQLLQKSGLDWTCVRSPVMTRERRVNYSLSPKIGSFTFMTSIPRPAVAKCLVDQVISKEYIGQAMVIKR